MIRRGPISPSALLPPLAGIVLVALFATLGFWQLDRAEEKRQISSAFDAEGGYAALTADAEYEMYQRISAYGRYLDDRQFLLENIVQDGQVGYYVITPFEYAADKPLLIVNRGWIPKDREGSDTPVIDVPDADRTIRGRVGQLPRVGIRPGPAFDDAAEWPRRAVWPELDELAAELGRQVRPFVLLADPVSSPGFVRRWQPQQIGPMRHVGYAVQWFALALAVIVTGIVLVRRKGVVR